MTTENAAERLGRLVRARRKRLQLHTAADFAEAAQVSTRLIGDLETGRRSNFSAANKASIEDTLDWEYGSIDDTLAGGDPRERVAPVVNQEPTPMSRKEIARFVMAAERVNDGTQTDDDDKVIEDFLAREKASAAIRPGPDLGKLLEVNYASWRTQNERMNELLEHPGVSTDDRIRLLELGIDSSDTFSDFLILCAYESTDTRARDTLPAVFAMRSAMKERLQGLLDEARQMKVTSLADRRKVPPPPSLDESDVAASRREKQSDRDRDDDDHE